MLEPSTAALAVIRKYEGCKLIAYRCPAGVWTVGWGATGPGITKGVIWTQDRADQRLLSDVEEVAEQVRFLVGKAPTTQGQFDALVSFAYNVGTDIDDDSTPEGLGDSSLLKKHLRRDYQGAAAEFTHWDKARVNGVLKVLPGLVLRRASEAKIYLS